MTDARKNILVVGAGFAGAVHARALAEAGYEVDVIDQRPHIAGNAFDSIDANGVRVHRYGPHLFHTNNERVVDWMSRFTTLVPYEHKVLAEVTPTLLVPLPVNRRTIAAVFDTPLDDEAAARAFLETLAEPIADPANAAEYLYSRIGRRLTDLFFRPYTRKMWQMELEEMSAAVVQRIPLRTDDEDRYFPNDRFQFLPRDGYTAMFERIFDHPRIRVSLDTAFEPSMRDGMAHCFNSMPIDTFYGDRFGPLPYRSIRFHHTTAEGESAPAGRAATVNFTDAGPYTRETDWSALPGHRAVATGRRTLTREEPCDYLDNDLERYYPVKTSDGRFDAIYRQYKALAEQERDLTFIGRCGTYQYLDMHQVINQSLMSVASFLDAAGSEPSSASAGVSSGSYQTQPG